MLEARFGDDSLQHLIFWNTFLPISDNNTNLELFEFLSLPKTYRHKGIPQISTSMIFRASLPKNVPKTPKMASGNIAKLLAVSLFSMYGMVSPL